MYIGFGSLTTKDPQKLGAEILEGVRLAGVRALLATGWGGLEDTRLPENVHVIKCAPHDALFRRVRAVVHHGGAGSTAAGLRAGLPTLICFMAVDQPFWGNRVHQLGCGPKPLNLKKLKAADLAQALKVLTTTRSFRQRAEEVARGIAAEDGIQRAIEVIEAQGCDA